MRCLGWAANCWAEAPSSYSAPASCILRCHERGRGARAKTNACFEVMETSNSAGQKHGLGLLQIQMLLSATWVLGIKYVPGGTLLSARTLLLSWLGERISRQTGQAVIAAKVTLPMAADFSQLFTRESYHAAAAAAAALPVEDRSWEAKIIEITRLTPSASWWQWRP